jgi:hypothetical protein
VERRRYPPEFRRKVLDLVVVLDEQQAGQAQQRGVVGTMPTTSVGRPISRLTRSSGLVLCAAWTSACW